MTSERYFGSLANVSEAEWAQLGAGSAVYELIADGGPVARLELHGTKASGETARGVWRLERDVTRTLRVWDQEDASLVGEFESSSWSGRGTFRHISGRSYPWEPGNVWRSVYRFRGPDGPVVELGSSRGLLRRRTALRVIIGDSPELDLLVLAGQYLLVVSAVDDGIAAGAAVAGSIVH